MTERPLWAPWRIEYIIGPKDDQCIFCAAASSPGDKQSHVVARRRTCVMMLNAFPYAPGHLMVAPVRHVAELDGLDPEELAELMCLTRDAVAALRRGMKPDGFNVGLNLGRTAGAGIADHLHMHVVPRWDGDVNFMPLLAGTHVMPQALEASRRVIVEALGEL